MYPEMRATRPGKIFRFGTPGEEGESHARRAPMKERIPRETCWRDSSSQG